MCLAKWDEHQKAVMHCQQESDYLKSLELDVLAKPVAKKAAKRKVKVVRLDAEDWDAMERAEDRQCNTNKNNIYIYIYISIEI